MIINEGPAPVGYYDRAGRYHFYDPEQALARGDLRLGACSCGNSTRRVQGLGALGEPWDTVLLIAGAGLGMGALVWLWRRGR